MGGVGHPAARHSANEDYTSIIILAEGAGFSDESMKKLRTAAAMLSSYNLTKKRKLGFAKEINKYVKGALQN